MIRLKAACLFAGVCMLAQATTQMHEKVAATHVLYQQHTRKKLPTTDREAYDYCKQHKHAFIAIVWPIAQGNGEEIREIFKHYGKIIYKKQFFFDHKFAYKILKKAHPLVHDMDEHVDWYFPVGTYEKPARIFVLEFKNAETAIACKMAVRQIFKMQYRPIHVNDVHYETVELAEFFFT